MEIPYHLFYCYARKDHKFLQVLRTHLKPLEREGLIIAKTDIDISPGTKWETTIIHHLEAADIIILLISPDFIASDYCFHEEMRRAIVRHEQGVARVIPVIIRPAFWRRMPFGELQALPKDAIPISTSQNRDMAFLSVAQGIRTVVQELTTGVAVGLRPEGTSRPPGQENLLPTASQERNVMDKKADSDKHIENHAPVYGQFNGGEYHGPITIGETIYINKRDGIHALKMGAQALLNENYSSARKELHIAVEEIDQGQQKRDAAKAHYLLALAVLGGNHPGDIGITNAQKVNELLNVATRLDQQCNAYTMTRAVIREPRLRKQTNNASITDHDKEMFAYLQCCQTDLYYQICQIFGI